jgi:hypothetical protein
MYLFKRKGSQSKDTQIAILTINYVTITEETSLIYNAQFIAKRIHLFEDFVSF